MRGVAAGSISATEARGVRILTSHFQIPLLPHQHRKGLERAQRRNMGGHLQVQRKSDWTITRKKQEQAKHRL